MQTVRFPSVIAAAGKPHQHLLWTEPSKDKTVSKALKEQRIMTLHQSAVGTKADYGSVGLEKSPQGQILIFPRSLAAFANKRVVGINYDLFTAAPVKSAPKSKPKPQAKRAPAPTPEPPEKPRRKPAPQKQPKPKATAKRPTKKNHAKILHFPASESPAPKKASAGLPQIKRKVRQALKALEQGRQVIAYELLKEIAK